MLGDVSLQVMELPTGRKPSTTAEYQMPLRLRLKRMFMLWRVPRASASRVGHQITKSLYDGKPQIPPRIWALTLRSTSSSWHDSGFREAVAAKNTLFGFKNHEIYIQNALREEASTTTQSDEIRFEITFKLFLSSGFLFYLKIIRKRVLWRHKDLLLILKSSARSIRKVINLSSLLSRRRNPSSLLSHS